MTTLTRPARKKQSARARGRGAEKETCNPPSELNPTFVEPDAKWVRTLWPSLPQNSAAKINLTAAGLDKYLQTPLLPLDLGLLHHALRSFDGSGIPWEKDYVKIDPQTVAAVTGLPASGDPVDMSAERRRANPGGRAKVALEICGSNKAFGSKGIRVDLIKPVELRWAAAVLTSRVFGQQKGEYLNLGHFNLVKRVSLGHRFNWAEYVACRIKDQMRKIQKEGKGSFYMGTVLSGLIYDQVPRLGPPQEGCSPDLGGGNPTLMKWAALCPKKERGCVLGVKQEATTTGYNTHDDEKNVGGAGIEISLVGNHGVGIPNLQNGKLPLVFPAVPLNNNGGIGAVGQGTVLKEEGRMIRGEPERMSFSQLLQKQVLLCSGGDMEVNVGLGNRDRTLSLDLVYKKLENPGGQRNAMVETACSLSGTDSPPHHESPKAKSSEVAEQVDSPRSVRKHPLVEREEEISSKRMKKPMECTPQEGPLLQQMTMAEHLQVIKTVFGEVEKKLGSANRDCDRWKWCTQELSKLLSQHFSELPMDEPDWQDILSEEPMDSVEIRQARAYVKKAAKIIKRQDTEIQLFKVKEEERKKLEYEREKLECENLALKRALETEQECRKSAEARAVNLETQLVQIKEKLQRVLDD